jgi:serine/threonine-protein kinase
VASVELLRRARDGDREALNQLLERQLVPFQEWADRRIPRSSRDSVDSKTLVMETVLHTVRDEPRFRPETDGALRIHLRDSMVERIRQAAVGVQEREPTVAVETAMRARASAALGTTVGHQNLAAYESALACLDGPQRETVVARVELRQDWEQIAAAVEQPSADAARSFAGAALCRVAQEMCGELCNSDRVSRLAIQVAKRSPVRWDDELDASQEPHERAVVQQLQIVAGVADLFWKPACPFDRLGDFEVLREIGRGGMGVVYEARQVSLDRPVALKVLSPEMQASLVQLKRFEREAKALAALNHPNIVTIHSVEEVEGTRFITMELVDGSAVAERIPEAGLSTDRVLELAIPLADALSSAHERGITHRDLKPTNIMVNDEGRVKILDFGLAKLREATTLEDDSLTPTRSLELTRGGAMVGTLPYMSPEQVQGGPLDHRSDLFSLGSVLYEMATGRRAFGGTTPEAVVSAIVCDGPPAVTELNPSAHVDLDRIVAHCLRKNPEHRYQTAKGLRNELEELRLNLRSAELPARPAGKIDETRPRWSPLRLPAILLVVLLVGFLAAPWVTDTFRRWFGPSAVPVEERYLAVLPFASLGDEDDTAPLSAGLTEILTAKLTQLAGTHGFQVASSSLTRGTSPPDVNEIGRKLGVNLAVVGSLQRHADDVRVTINLVDVRDGRQIGAEVVTAGVGDPFALQDRIVETAVRLLELELQPTEEQALLAHGTSVAEAYELYLEGRGYLRDYDDPENVDKAIAAFGQAVDKDTEYARAHAGLGSAYWNKYEHTLEPEWVERASTACGRSVELDERQADGHVCLGTLLSGTGEYAKAAVELGRAASLDPTNDEAFRGLGFAYERLGEIDSAEKTYLQAVSLRPHYWATHNWLGAFYAGRGRFDDAIESFEKVVELVPRSYRGYQNLGGVQLLLGRFKEATPILERSVELKPSAHGYSNLATAYFGQRQFDESVRFNLQAIELGLRDFSVWGNLGEAYYWSSNQREKSREAYERAVELAREQLEINADDDIALGELAKYYAMLGREEQARETIARALELVPDDPDTQFTAAIVHAKLGETEQALNWLEKSKQSGMTSGWIAANPVFDILAQTQHFQELIR